MGNQFVWLSQFIVFQIPTDAAPVSLETIPTIWANVHRQQGEIL